jgi:hypothetical protein
VRELTGTLLDLQEQEHLAKEVMEVVLQEGFLVVRAVAMVVEAVVPAEMGLMLV